MERLRPWLVWWATVIATGYFSFLYLHSWKAVAALAGVATGAIGFGLIFRDLLRRRPKIEWGAPESKTIQVEGRGGYIAYITVANRPKVGMESIHAMSVTLRYKNTDTGEILYDRIIGRWSHLRRIDDPVEADAHRRVVLEGDGYPYRIEVAAGFSGSPGMFVIDDRQKFQQLNMRPLGVGPVTVEVRFQGATPGRHIDETRKYKMTGLAHSIEVEVI